MRAELLLCALLAITGCTQKRIVRPSPGISWVNGNLLYEGRSFTGILEERFEHVGTIRETHYENGVSDGEQIETFVAGKKQIVARGEYRAGVKSGIHEGWFLNGARRFHHEYTNGQFHGEIWEWHASGHPSLFAKFDNGKLLGKKAWREDGKIYMNYVFPGGKPVGVPGTKLCFQVRNGDPNRIAAKR